MGRIANGEVAPALRSKPQHKRWRQAMETIDMGHKMGPVW